MEFKLKSKYKPTGDQPAAIDELVNSIESGNREQTLLGVTGSGKTFTMANIIERSRRKIRIKKRISCSIHCRNKKKQ